MRKLTSPAYTGTAGAWHGLVAPAVDALRDFVAAKAFGPFDPRSMARTWRLAIRKAEAAWATDPETRDRPWPVHADARPYDLRVQVWLDPANHHLPALVRLSVVPGGAALELLAEPDEPAAPAGAPLPAASGGGG
jgi:hypothetical protein